MAEPNPDAAARKKERQQEYQRQWYLKNREKALERARQRQVDPANHDRIREYQRKWAHENREKIRESKRRWREANPGKVRAQQARSRDYQRRYYETNRAKWRERQRQRNYGMDPATFMAMWEAQERGCYLCHRDLDMDEAAVDHWHGCPVHDPKKGCRACWRGLTHLSCNTVIGHGDDDPDLLRVIASNLEQANANVAAHQAAMPQHMTLF
jgi:hypothetical protein